MLSDTDKAKWVNRLVSVFAISPDEALRQVERTSPTVEAMMRRHAIGADEAIARHYSVRTEDFVESDVDRARREFREALHGLGAALLDTAPGRFFSRAVDWLNRRL